ncbi:MAG: NAD(P)H-dependent oxidoreductase [Symploca sp. SIO1B1]|nr:NAD(P)H-dependent oxidoreductase [Symploca sp. SIO1C2]NER94578.1 NAD(P)H-dependent oxidoreductase [Symploca sp. SIO1B1]
MSQPIKILAFAGSARIESFNKKLVKIAAEGAKVAGAEVTYLDFLDYPMPLFNQDLEALELPEPVVQFKALLKSHQGFIISCPEYNGSITPLLKNAIDWASRPGPGDAPALDCFKGKVAALLATSPGALGGMRGLVHVRAILEGIGVLVITEQKAIPGAYQAFDEQGNLKDEKQLKAVQTIATKLVDVTTKLS